MTDNNDFFDYPNNSKLPFPVEQGELPDRTSAPKIRLGPTSSSQLGSNTTRNGMRRIRGRRWPETMTKNMSKAVGGGGAPLLGLRPGWKE
ncbi:uncharacterized protein [Physcomitrium patens]|uniref:uncharacterized protein isoform X2 n=1 Tax=Physcomitrium patens TaxID=3218 RepID=UPI000D15F389|nr:uncharacterized protein LOC112284020 isoform X2 [Physcomitrium patens]|eukprot:XP_024379248.1 uncharacterized protein LOC112284020 isoform X2 [Physcomitrella patens]